jgi:hypothetical protein
MRIRHQTTRATIAAVLLGLFLCASARAQQASVFDQVPADALVVVRVKNLSATNKKLAKMIKELGLDQMQPELADPLGTLQKAGHLEKGLNTDGDLAFAFLDPKLTGGNPEKSMVFVIPVTDFKAFVGNFKDAKEEGGVTKASPPEGGEDVYLAQWGKFAAVSPAKEVLAKKPTGLKLQGVIAKEADTKDLLVYANMNAIRPMALPQLKDGRQQLMKEVDDGLNMAGDMGKKFGPVVRALVGQVVNVAEGFLNDATGATLGIGLSDAGVTTTVLADFKPDSYAGKLASQQKTTNQPLVAGLPDRKYFMFGGSVQDPKLAVRVASDFLDPVTKELANVPEGKAIANAVDALKKTMAAVTGSSIGIVAPSGALGQESLIQEVVVMQGDAAAIAAGERQMMQATADIMKMIPQQQGMSTKFEMKPGGKTVAGVQLDTFETKINVDENNPEAAQVKQIMAMVYGPSGQTGVMGQVGPKTYVLVQGGNDQLISDAIGAAKANSPVGAAAAQSVKTVASHLPQNRTAEFYIEVDEIVSTALRYAKGFGVGGNMQLKGDLPPIGAAVACEQNAIRMDGFIPLDLVKGLVSFGMEAQKQMNKPGGGL